MAEFINTEDLGDVIAQTIVQIRAGVRKSREAGIVARLPENVTFDMVVISQDGWQALDQTSSTKNDGKETQGGGTTETTTSNESTKTSQQNQGTSEDTTTNTDKTESSQNSQSTTNTTGSNVSNGNDTGTTTTSDTTNQSEAGGSNTNSTRSSDESSTARNTHVQRDSIVRDFEKR